MARSLKSEWLRWPALTIVALSAGCDGSDAVGVTPPPGEATDAAGVTRVTGHWAMPPFVGEWFTERAVVLTDLTAFVRREPGLPLPGDPTVGRFTTDSEGLETFSLNLPITPRGTFHQLEAGADGEPGVQVYAVSVGLNVVGDAFLERFDMTGWASELTSIVAAHGTRELIGGRMLVWSPGATRFSSGFGADGRLFTADDPLSPLDAGWTVIDLDVIPFARLRESSAEVNIVTGDVQQDLSDSSYTAAFDALTTELTRRYPYTSVKQLDWSAIVAEVRPLVVQADEAHDTLAFDAALMRLAVLTRDGHVAVNPPAYSYLLNKYGAGYGLRLAQIDDGSVLVIDAPSDAPAARAGIEAGAEITSWNGLGLDAAIDETELAFSASSPHGTRLQQLALLPRTSVGTQVTLEYRNAGATSRARVELTAVDDPLGAQTALAGDFDPTAMPISISVLPSGIGVVRVTSFEEDVTLLTHAWEFALERLIALDVPSLIVDMRGNSGGVNQPGAYFAGSFYSEPFLRSQRFALDATGELVHNGDDMIVPSPIQWQRPVAVLIDAGCYSVCEEFVAAMAVNPEHLIVGSSRTAGVEAEVRFWALPDGLQFYAPLGLYRYPDGELFIEGTGLAPNLRVPVTRESLLSPEDEVMEAAVSALTAGSAQE